MGRPACRVHRRNQLRGGRALAVPNHLGQAVRIQWCLIWPRRLEQQDSEDHRKRVTQASGQLRRLVSEALAVIPGRGNCSWCAAHELSKCSRHRACYCSVERIRHAAPGSCKSAITKSRDGVNISPSAGCGADLSWTRAKQWEWALQAELDRFDQWRAGRGRTVWWAGPVWLTVEYAHLNLNVFSIGVPMVNIDHGHRIAKRDAAASVDQAGCASSFGSGPKRFGPGVPSIQAKTRFTIGSSSHQPLWSVSCMRRTPTATCAG